MPQAAKPKPIPQETPRVVHNAGAQENFEAPALALAEKLGWSGEPDWVANDITVADARNYLAKVMHEHFQAGAKGADQPDYKAACEHLAVDNDSEQSAIDEALAAAYGAGKGATVTSQPVTVAGMAANLSVGAAAGLGKLIEAGSKGRV
jgi:hypothetical protein